MKHLFRYSLATFLALTGLLAAANDEPDEMSWERFSHDLTAYRHFKSYQVTHPIPRDLSTSQCPASFPTITVRPTDFLTQKSGWKLSADKRGITAGYGHGRYAVHAPLKVSEPGTYRVWVKYRHIPDYVASFQLAIRPHALLGKIHSEIRSTQGCFYSHKFDWAPYAYKGPVQPPTQIKKPYGLIWEAGPMVDLGPGDYTLELTTLVHAGPYTSRHVAMIVLTADPMSTGMDELVGENAYAASDPIRQNWNIWERRPGALPWEALTPQQQTYYLGWKRTFMAKLATNPEDDDEKQLTYLSYFDEDHNLIGTPANVAAEQKHLKSLVDQGYYQGFIKRIEAEDMTVQKGWKVANKENASGKVLYTSYWDGLETATATVEIPQPGVYQVWARHFLLHQYFATFDLSFMDEQGKEIGRLDYGQPKNRYKNKNFSFIWERKAIRLPAGKFTFQLRKNVGKSPYTSRYVDQFIITGARNLTPDDLHEKISSNPTTLWLQDDPWNGFSRWSAPQTQDKLEPKSIHVTIPQGDAESLMIHLRNDTQKPIQLTPELSEDINLQLRLIAYLKTDRYDWTPAVLLERDAITAPALQNTSLWITIPTKGLETGTYQPTITLDRHTITLNVTVTKPNHKRKTPIVGGWSQPLRRQSCWQLYKDIGVNLVYNNIITKAEMERYQIRHLCLGLDFTTEDSIRNYQAMTRAMGLKETDWSAFLYDEPTAGMVAKWVAAAKRTRTAAPSIQIWCNPGEVQTCTPAVVRKMMAYIDYFCPYTNHFTSKDETYRTKELPKIGKVKLLYTTPCFSEKASNSPRDMLYLANLAAHYNRDGWSCFSLFCCYPYSNSIWDEINPFDACQSISYYPGAYGRTLSTRHMEAVREAIQRYRNGTTTPIK